MPLTFLGRVHFPGLSLLKISYAISPKMIVFASKKEEKKKKETGENNLLWA